MATVAVNGNNGGHNGYGGRGSAPHAVRAEEIISDIAHTLSVSQMSCFIDCGAKYWFKYGLKIREVRDGKRARGTAVHESIAYALEIKRDTGRDAFPADAVEQFDCELEDAMQDARLQEGESYEELRLSGRALVDKWVCEALPAVVPAAVEAELTGLIGGVVVAGVVDCIERNGRIRDVKTSSSRRGLSNAQRFQLATYVLLASQQPAARELPRPTGLTQIDSLVATKAPQLNLLPYIVTSADVEHARAMFPAAQQAIRGGFYLPNRASLYCSRKKCSYWGACEKEFGGTVA